MKITPTHRRVTLLELVAGAAFCGGGLTVSALAEPEVVTISEAVPSVCVQAIQSGTEAIAAERRVEQYTDKAAARAGEVTLADPAGDGEKLEQALSPLAQPNEDGPGNREERSGGKEGGSRVRSEG